MATLEWNKEKWDSQYNWQLKGEEWSSSWRNSEAQWFSSLYPRIHRFIGCGNILEIASGYGRWSKFLIEYASSNFRGVDLSGECVDYCNANLKSPNASFILNDGTSLEDVSDIKYDFVFSFDSLVHVNPDVLEKYISQIIPLLNTNGTCFIHHSNFGSIIEKGGINNQHRGYTHIRDQSTSAKIVRDLVLKHKGRILCQEIIDWGGGEAIDCLTVFSKEGAYPNYVEKQMTNKHFMTEAKIIKNYHSQYCIF